jgi:hypothetical protein
MLYTTQNLMTQEETEVRDQRDIIFNQVKELFNFLKTGEDKAQVQMLEWENYVIQQEKMQKLRENVIAITSTSTTKLRQASLKSSSMKSINRFFQQTCFIMESCQTKQPQYESNTDYIPRVASPTHLEGDRTTVSSGEVRGAENHAAPGQPLHIMHDRRSLSMGNND